MAFWDDACVAEYYYLKIALLFPGIGLRRIRSCTRHCSEQSELGGIGLLIRGSFRSADSAPRIASRTATAAGTVGLRLKNIQSDARSCLQRMRVEKH
jgi:hypothetical protein